VSHAARVFGEGYRGRPLETQKIAGVEHLVPGQHEAIWTDVEHTVIELSYVGPTGHTFFVVLIDGDTLKPIRMAVAQMGGLSEEEIPPNWELSAESKAAIAKLKTKIEV
jgi:hypothetical protein